ncbi:MAG TPA: hypothetical protein VGG72_13730 [Bryobacteraceae bacterium]|jgi:hypothetical protein
MYRTLRLSLFPIAAVLLFANASWNAKPISQWDQEDCKQVLTSSPWVKFVMPAYVRDLSPDERVQGGNWEEGRGGGVGLAGLGIFGPARQAEAIARAHAKPPAGTVAVRWESALPVRTAEEKTGETGAPILDNDHYAIAVYDIAAPTRWNLENELKGIAYLKRNKKKDMKPSRVQVLRQIDGLATVVYFFPRSQEITRKDGWVTFAAQIGRLFVTQAFSVDEMQLQGKLEL